MKPNKRSSLPAFLPPDPERSRNMAAIRNRNTKLEYYVRHALHTAGFRFRLHRSDLPGRPDIVLPKYRVAVIVQGCFWHGHDCQKGRLPKTNNVYWSAKIARNVERDARTSAALIQQGWKVVAVWGCSLEEGTRRLVDLLCECRDDNY